MFFNMKMQTNIVLAVLFFTTTFIQCYPITTTETEQTTNLPMKEESTLPNGTVVGKYSYKDQDGNPVQVKYFADNSGYGVELKSIKVVNGSGLLQIGDNPKLDFLPNDLLPQFPPSPIDKDSHEIFNFHFPSDNKARDSDELAKNPKTRWNVEKRFDFGLPRDLTKVKKCATAKVRIYYDELNRKERDIYKDEMPKVCEQF